MKYKGKLALLIFITFSASAFSDAYEPSMVVIPTTGWGVIFASPPLKKYEAKRIKNSFRYYASAYKYTQISIYVEPSVHNISSPEGCKNYYWNKAKKNPLIREDTINFISDKLFDRVSYFTDIKIQNQDRESGNINFYGYRDGYCIDVHFSKIVTGRDDLAVIMKFTRSLSYYK